MAQFPWGTLSFHLLMQGGLFAPPGCSVGRGPGDGDQVADQEEMSHFWDILHADRLPGCCGLSHKSLSFHASVSSSVKQRKDPPLPASHWTGISMKHVREQDMRKGGGAVLVLLRPCTVRADVRRPYPVRSCHLWGREALQRMLSVYRWGTETVQWGNLAES